jgi:hypothetical protein
MISAHAAYGDRQKLASLQILRAIFITVKGQLRYAAENEGALVFVEEADLQNLKGGLRPEPVFTDN